MYIIAGLGNPGKQYVDTRHNIGFDAVDVIASAAGIKINKLKHRALVGEGNIKGEKVVLVKPQTFMNLSGECIREIVEWHKAETERLIVIYDDVALPLGDIRIREKGSAGGHNGMKNIIYQLNTEQFPRIRIGVGAPEHKEHDLADFVLGKFSKDEIKLMIPIVKLVADATEDIISNGTAYAMNKYN